MKMVAQKVYIIKVLGLHVATKDAQLEDHLILAACLGGGKTPSINDGSEGRGKIHSEDKLF